VSPVFRHGRLRLYLLKLLDESPRHGYEVIRLLQDRFMGVYAPSPGTIYPRLARLEEDGLVTHEEVDGKKVYSITDKGREEIRSRLGDLADLEDELTESLRDVARGISEDVRDTVRTIREELASAAREFRTDGGKPAGGSGRPGDSAGGGGGGKSDKADKASQSGQGGSEEARRIRDEARRTREQMRASFREQSRSHGDWAAWQGWSGRSPWSAWSDSTDSREEPGASGGEPGSGTSQDKPTSGTGPRSRRPGQNPFSDLERMAIQFATELRAAAKQTGNLGERSLNDLRDILTDTLAKVRVEVFDDNGDTGRDQERPAGEEPPSAPGKTGDHGDDDARPAAG
jgi:DNA-binding PadR family transcriptional regulator